MDAETRQFLIANSIAPMQGIHETLNAMKHAADWAQARERVLSVEVEPLVSPKETDGMDMLTEDKGKRWLKYQGVVVPEGKVVPAQQVADAASEIGFPVALKMMSPLLAHKTEAGAVVLNLNDASAVTAATAQMKADVAAHDAKAVTDQFLVEAMSPPPLAELIVTLRRDSQFGSALVLGSGGILVELIGDAVTVLLPSSSDDIERALERLRVAQLLTGFRGRPKADTAKIAAQLYALCQAYLEGGSDIAEIEINPMFVYKDHICAVDALMHKAVAS